MFWGRSGNARRPNPVDGFLFSMLWQRSADALGTLWGTLGMLRGVSKSSWNNILLRTFGWKSLAGVLLQIEEPCHSTRGQLRSACRLVPGVDWAASLSWRRLLSSPCCIRFQTPHWGHRKGTQVVAIHGLTPRAVHGARKACPK